MGKRVEESSVELQRVQTERQNDKQLETKHIVNIQNLETINKRLSESKTSFVVQLSEFQS